MWFQAADAERHFRRLALGCVAIILLGAILILVYSEAGIQRLLSGNSLSMSYRPYIKDFSDYALSPFYVFFIGIWWYGKKVSDMRFVVIAYGYLIAQLMGSVLSVRMMKIFFGRARPDAGTEPGMGTEWIGPTLESSFHSFPSGHTADLFTSAMFGAALVQRGWVGVLLFVLAIMVGLTRVMLSKHYPFDVIGGAVIGGMISMAVLYLYVLPHIRKFSQHENGGNAVVHG